MVVMPGRVGMPVVMPMVVSVAQQPRRDQIHYQTDHGDADRLVEGDLLGTMNRPTDSQTMSSATLTGTT